MTTTLTDLDELTVEVIRAVTAGPSFPLIKRWQVSWAENGLPLISGRLDLDPRSAQHTMHRLASEYRLRQLRVDDPARICLHWTWPEPPIYSDTAMPDQTLAIVEIWTPTGGAA